MGKNRKRKRQKHSLLVGGSSASNISTTAVLAARDPALLILARGGGEEDDDDSASILVEQGDDLTSAISEAALETTIQTLQKIAEGGSTNNNLQDKRFKPLRRALHPLVLQQLQSYDHGTDYRIKITQALQNHKWADALAGLEGCRDFQQIPKQGTIQRWVRDCDLAPDSCKMLLLNAILVVGNQEESTSSSSPSGAGAVTTTTTTNTTNDAAATSGGIINKHDPRFVLEQQQQYLGLKSEPSGGEGEPAGDMEIGTTIKQAESSSSLLILEDWSLGRLMVQQDDDDDDENHTDWDAKLSTRMSSLESRILYQEKAAERKPPNHYDLLLHTTTKPDSIQWSSSSNRPPIVKHEVPFLKSQKKGDAFVLENVLTLDECQQLRAAATTLGFRPDHPTAMDKPTGIDSCEWMVDDSILSVINHRVQPFLDHHHHHHHQEEEVKTTTTTTTTASKATTTTSTTFASINPRWRFFRYGQGCVYRPHIDGSWPASRITPDGQYECYSEEKKKKKKDDDSSDGTKSSSSITIKSFHTFLIYLNDNFAGGQTRFYFPHHHDRGGGGSGGGGSSEGGKQQQQQLQLAAQGVTPKCGSVLVFSQGNTASLLHEGSAVTSGTKYVVRTDVLYRVSQY